MISPPLCCTLVLLLALLAGCRTADVTSEHDYATNGPAKKPGMIYVENFELEAGNVKYKEGVVEEVTGRSGPVLRILSGADDPKKRAQEVIDLMANSLVKDLKKAGFPATRIKPGSPLASQGWLLRGIFTEVQEGNRFQRSMIGFGEGGTDVQLIAVMSDLAKGPPTPLYDVTTAAKSGKWPGAAPTVVFGPWGAAARFILAGRDLDENIKQTATKITEDVVRHTQGPKPSTDIQWEGEKK
jgi:hypothetical protein